MSDSIAILNNKQIVEKKHLLNSIKETAGELRIYCDIASNSHEFFSSETIELIHKYFNLSNEIIDFCKYEADNHVNLDEIQLINFYEKMKREND